MIHLFMGLTSIRNLVCVMYLRVNPGLGLGVRGRGRGRGGGRGRGRG